MSTTFTSVKDLLKATGTKEHVREFDELMRCTNVVREMIQIRIKAGLTQKDLAERMQVSQGTISKIENSVDCDISLGELTSYAAYCKAKFTLRVGPPISLVQSVKEHALALKSDLDKLAAVACENEDDYHIPKKISEFFNEAGFNLMSFLVDAAEKLPRSIKEARMPMLRIVSPCEDVETVPSQRISRKKPVAVA